MYIVSVISKNEDFLESLPQAILNYNLGSLKFYFFSKVEQLNHQVKLSGLPDLLLADRDVVLGEVWEKYPVNKVYLSEKGDGEDQIFIYKNTAQFLLDIQRRISLWQEGEGMVNSQLGVDHERKLIWFLEPSESEWGKSCYNSWLETKYKTGRRMLGMDLSRMGIRDRGMRAASSCSLSDLLQSWLCGKGQLMDNRPGEQTSILGFTIIEGVKHPMDIEMLRPEFVEKCLGTWGGSFDEVGIYAPFYNEALAKCLLRYTKELFLVSDQSGEYDEPLHQMKTWLKEIHPKGPITLMHSRSDPNRRAALKQKIIDQAVEKGGSI